MTDIKLDLTDSEWMSLIDMERDGLPICCGNVSALRDEVIKVAREGCTAVDYRASRFLQTYQWAINSHPELAEVPQLTKIAKACAKLKGCTVPVPGDPDKPALIERIDH